MFLYNGVLILNDYLNSAITQEIKDIFVELAFSSAELCSGMSNIQDKLK